MRLSLKFLYLIPLFLVISTDTLYIQMGINTFKQIATLFTLVPLFFLKELTPFLRKWYYLFLLYFIALCLESYYVYNTPLKHLHVSAKVMVCFFIFGIYGFYKRFDKITIQGLVFIIVVSFAANGILVNSGAFTIGAFLANKRGFACESVYMLIIPLLYNLNIFMKTNNLINMLSFFILLGIIFFLQHRTVWVMASIALGINLLLLHKTNIRPQLTSLVLASTFIGILLTTVVSYVISDDKISAKIQKSIDQIINPTGDDKDDEVSTSEWRYMQFQSYWPYVEENPILGMRFKGFELPIQFYDHTGRTPFQDNTGHHFHSFYLDRLFYQGILGLVLLILPPFLYIAYCLSKLKKLTNEQLILFSYVATVLIFGFSYNWPEYFYGILGYTILMLESNHSSDKEKLEEKASTILNQQVVA